jgi:hypothetical protein
VEWRCVGAGLPDAATGEGFAGAVVIRRRHRGMAHPDLLTGPALLLRVWFHGLAKQGPLHAECRAVPVDEIRRHVPPFDPVIRVGAVVGRKRKHLAGNDVRKSFAVGAEPGKALRPRQRAAEAGGNGGAGEGAAGDREPIAHRRKS